MTDPQRQLFKTEPAYRPMTPRQARIFGHFEHAPDGLDACELGAILHAELIKHSPDERCEWCGRDGMRAINERAIRERLVRGPAGVYRMRDRKTPAPSEPAELPGETWEDAFGADSPLARSRKDAA